MRSLILLNYKMQEALSARNKTSRTSSDKFTAVIRTSNGSTITTVQSQSNTNAHGWTQYTFDVTTGLSGYLGKQIEIYFKETTTSSSSTTDFYVDDIAFNDIHS